MGWMARVEFPAETRDFFLLLSVNGAYLASNVMRTGGLSLGGKVVGA
jgi:hypothetical protein